MKHTIWITILLFFITGCGKEEAVEISIEKSEENLSEDVLESEKIETPIAESLEVVEESSSEIESKNTAIVLAREDNLIKTTPKIWKYREGRNFSRLVPTQPTSGSADKIEVAEIFMYSCPHCLTLEPHLNEWTQDLDSNVRFVRIPAIFNQLAQMHAQLHYTKIFLSKNGLLKDPTAFHQLIFEEYHNRGNRLTSKTAIERLFARAGIESDDFNRTWNSFEVNQALRIAQDLARRYNVTSVPMVVVNGKYQTDVSRSGGIPQLFEVIDELIEREGVR
jgi:thiol:disulfide interchange protein DsbA